LFFLPAHFASRARRSLPAQAKKAERLRRLAEDAAVFEASIQHEMSLATGKASDGGGGAADDDDDDGDDGDLAGWPSCFQTALLSQPAQLLAASFDGPRAPPPSGAHARDVHLRSFDLENKRGAGTLLANADLTLAAGRRSGPPLRRSLHFSFTAVITSWLGGVWVCIDTVLWAATDAAKRPSWS
jgi:hypothetical protein